MSPIRMTLNFYPRPPRGGRPGCGGELAVNVNISIHALREEGDDCGTQGLRWIAISIHALREEGDGRRYFMGLFNFLFLSTPSARRATGAIHGGETFQWNFYPRPPRGGRRNAVNSVINFFKISIHALREEGDGLRKSSDTP